MGLDDDVALGLGRGPGERLGIEQGPHGIGLESDHEDAECAVIPL